MNYRRSRFFVGVAVAAMAALAIAPSTGWIVRQQLHLIAGHPMPGLDADTSHGKVTPDSRELAVASAHLLNFNYQVAIAVQDSGQTGDSDPSGIRNVVVHNLLGLRTQFDDQPALQALILRYMTMGDLRIGRERDERVLYSRQKQAELERTTGRSPVTLPTAAALTLTEETAVRGEALDPDNGFFPAMQATALFGERRDNEAVAALEEAATKPNWNDYADQEVQARWSLLSEARGQVGALPRAAIMANLLFPHLARIRDTARMATAYAIQREMAGDVECGFRVRRAVAHFGGLMRAKSTYTVSGLVGAAVAQEAVIRPGGEPGLDYPERDRAKGAANYVAYLNRIGQQEEARWFAAESQADDTVRAITAADSEKNGDFGEPFLQAVVLTGWWATGVLLLLSAFWTLALGLGATQFARWQSRQAGQAASVDSPKSRLRRVATGLASTVGFAGLLGGGAVLGCTGFAHAYDLSMRCLIWGYNGQSSDLPFCLTGGLIAIAVPAITLVVLAIRSRVRREPILTGVVQGMKHAALPVTATLLLLYSATVIGVRINEARVRATEAAIMANEGVYVAGQVHQAWPGVVADAGKPRGL